MYVCMCVCGNVMHRWLCCLLNHSAMLQECAGLVWFREDIKITHQGGLCISVGPGLVLNLDLCVCLCVCVCV